MEAAARLPLRPSIAFPFLRCGDTLSPRAHIRACGTPIDTDHRVITMAYYKTEGLSP
jgi:hypothetical protein